MNALIESIKSGKLWNFHGGIHPLDNKSQSNSSSIGQLQAGGQVVIPLKQHIGKSGELRVKVGDKVLKGQALTQCTSRLMLPVHAPISGTVSAIEPRVIAHASGLTEPCIVIDNDHQHTWVDLEPCDDINTLSAQELLHKIRTAGIAGLGGGGFPCADKIESGNNRTEILIINAAECEPYITADDVLMRYHATEIIQGIDILCQILEPKLTIIGIEDNKPEAIEALNIAAKNHDIVIRVIPTKYPSGGEKQLIEILTGKQIPSKGIPADIGVLVHNVGSLFAIQQAVVEGKPLIERVLTLTGNAFSQPRNYWAPIGTLISDVLYQVEHQIQSGNKLIMGGPMMGFTLPHTNVPIVKTSNCLLAPSKKELTQQGQEMPCIRCGQCAAVCPSSLLPQQLYWHAKGNELNKCEQLNLADCVECGACAFVCPSQIPLVNYYRQAKAAMRIEVMEAEAAEKARQRFEDRKQRLAREKAEREAKIRQMTNARKQDSAENGAITAAIARVKQKQTLAYDATQTDKKSAVAAAIARAKAKQAQSTTGDAPDNSEMRQLREQRKQQARLKRQLAEEQKNTLAEDKPIEDKNAKVAAAIARAKAKKQAQQKDNQ